MHRSLVVVAALAALGLSACGFLRPRVRSGPPLPSVPSRAEIAAAMGGASDPILRCVSREHRGTLRASVVFTSHGQVSSVDLHDWRPPTDGVAMRSCVADVLYRLELSPFESKELFVEVAYELW